MMCDRSGRAFGLAMLLAEGTVLAAGLEAKLETHADSFGLGPEFEQQLLVHQPPQSS